MKEDIFCKIEGRIKSPFSIWNKIKNKNISFEQLSDIMAFTILIENLEKGTLFKVKNHNSENFIKNESAKKTNFLVW